MVGISTREIAEDVFLEDEIMQQVGWRNVDRLHHPPFQAERAKAAAAAGGLNESAAAAFPRDDGESIRPIPGLVRFMEHERPR